MDLVTVFLTTCPYNQNVLFAPYFDPEDEENKFFQNDGIPV
jgi:hypothetical protein